MRRILIATEGTPVSADALRAFARIFGHGLARLHVLTVLPPLPWPGAAEAGLAAHRGAEEAQEALDLAIADLADAGLEAEAVLRFGQPAATIVAVAQELGCDLIVLGTHDRHGLERELRGSVAEDVLRSASCAVFVYPQLSAVHGLAAAVWAS